MTPRQINLSDWTLFGGGGQGDSYNHKSLFETKVETALHRATTDINFKTFEQLQLENPELKNEKMNFSDTTSIFVEFANELQIEKWDKFTVNDFINMHNMVKAMNIHFDYLNLGFSYKHLTHIFYYFRHPAPLL